MKYFVYEGVSHTLLLTKKGAPCEQWSLCGMWILPAQDTPPERYRVTDKLETKLCEKCKAEKQPWKER